MTIQIKTNQTYTSLERESFFELAEAAFDIHFREWFKHGEWNSSYRCYSVVKKERIVSNVGISRMRLVVNGKSLETFQLGTVMTAPDEERRGYATRLLTHLLSQHDLEAHPYFLASDLGVESFYERFGFVFQEESEPYVCVTGTNDPLPRIDVSRDVWRQLKQTSVPYAPDFYVTGDEHVWMFYFDQGMDQHVYWMDPYHLIYQIEGERLRLYAVLSTTPIDWSSILSRLAFDGIREIVFEFTPPIATLHRSIKDGQWMVRTTYPRLWPSTYRFPTLSKT